MNSIEYSNAILDSIETVTNDKISNAKFNKTIRGVISKVEDNIIGKYKVKYQDSEIEAFANNPDITYSKGTLVDILVPNGDFSERKLILNSITEEKSDDNIIIEELSKYTTDSENSINSDQEFGVCSYHEDDKVYLYQRDIEDFNYINYDETTFKESLKNNDKILCGAKFRTDFDGIQKRDGNFGITYEIDFKDNLTGNIVTKLYTVDVNKMLGTPYDQTRPTRQYGVFKINSENFDSVKSIYFFCKDFSIIDETKTTKDIFASDFELYPVRELSYDEMNSYILSLKKEGKGYFDETSTSEDNVKINATLKFKNQPVVSTIAYYWFVENNDVKINDINYINYGGEGWECINRYNVTDDGEKMWLTEDNFINVPRTKCGNAKTKVRCIAVRDNAAAAEKEIYINNYHPDHTVTVESNQGTQFYFDNGNPTLICKVDGIEDDNYIYQWSTVDVDGTYSDLEETTATNTEYEQISLDYKVLMQQIEAGIKMPEATKERLDNLKAELKRYEYIQRVDGNRIIHVDLSQIIEEKTFKCTVKQNDEIVGIAEITIKNTLGIEGEYKLNIINGTQVFSYDFNGVAPTSDSLEKPIEIQPLSFEIIDNQGKVFNEDILSQCSVQWTVPKTNTMIRAIDSNELTLNYSIADTFDYKKLNNNNIKLEVWYKNLHLQTHTEFTFTKDGEPGTNATGVICRIVPNTDDVLDGYPMLINGVPNFTPSVADWWFKVQIWEKGKMVYNNYQSGQTSEGQNVTVKWSNSEKPIRIGNTTINNPTIFDVDNNGFSYNSYDNAASSIIKVEVTYKGNTYYSNVPLIVLDNTNNDYNAELIENSGFRYVMYDTDGKRPQYDNNRPFSIKVTKDINDFIEDISIIENEYQVDYTWTAIGKVYNRSTQTYDDAIHLIANPDVSLERNQMIYTPTEEYDGDNLDNNIEIQIFEHDSASPDPVMKLLVPIYFYLDRYGITAINEWDGNSIDTGKGDTILAPQVGAGKKENDNSFTGIVIGGVKTRLSGSEDLQEGLFGYSHGQRSIFLDAYTGKAEFGLAGSGQITIDPSQGAKIYGGNYNTTSGTGMLIDLNAPSINWGNSKFSVDSNGNITAKAGHIGGLKIDDYGIWCDNGSNSAGMGVVNHRWAFWAGATENNSGNAPFHVGHGGELYASNANISGYINVNQGGKIGNWEVWSDGTLTSTGSTSDTGPYTIRMKPVQTISTASDPIFWAGTDQFHPDFAIFPTTGIVTNEIQGGIQTGKDWMTSTASNAQWIYFDYPFYGEPTVIITPQTTNSGTIAAKVREFQWDGLVCIAFKPVLGGSVADSYCAWVAIGNAKLS